MSKLLFALALVGILIFSSACEKKETTTFTTTDSVSNNIPDSQDTTEPQPPGVPSPDVPGGTTPGQQDGTTTEPGADRGEKPRPEAQNIIVTAPMPGQTISSGTIEIYGKARTFENGYSYLLRNASGKVIAEGHGTAVGETGQWNPYHSTLKTPFSGDATLEVFEYSAKDGSRINLVSIPIKLAGGIGESMSIKVFWTEAAGNQTDCTHVLPRERSMPKTSAVADAALRALLAGPTPREQKEGLRSQIPAGTALNKVTISGSRATADFSSALKSAAGSCRVQAIRSQIERTLMQFPTVSSVTITSDGSKAVLEP